ncbi:MAG: hypothetical protein KC729_19815, partial [Candidatus Eisenbacteria bacterium]|nr:hypothetical protein [Candidatus Eisenbacteria bacterium]
MLTIKPPVGYASIALGVAALHAVLWFTIQSPPCQDVPFHVAAAELIARSRSAPLEFFTVNTLFWRPNTGFEQVASRFPALPPSAWIVV